ncbi:MAG TPA: hypothetical protein EYH15_01355 [Methanothermococcus okinawensis]|uniref:Energy-converting hydrogenase B, subunit J n=1 Tax=Methanothermococcus okinawensis TaxID=155863 RepID=A0A833E1D2_9EURY|nr:hypothetical protein [Methanothermococcus okinawensis]
MILGFILGRRITAKLNIWFYLLVGVVVGYLLGPLPYYNFPLSYSFLFSLLGLLLGNLTVREK